MKQLIECDKALSLKRGQGGNASLTLNDYMSREFSNGRNISQGPVPVPKPPRVAAAAKETAEQAAAADAVHVGGAAATTASAAGALDE